MDRRLVLLLSAPLFVLTSSWLGLNAFPLLTGGDHDPGALFAQVWNDSLFADAVFVAGTIAAALAADSLAKRSWILALVAGFAFHWLVYFASYWALSDQTRIADQAAGDAFVMMFRWGWPGLLFAAAAPVALAWYGSRAPRDAASP